LPKGKEDLLRIQGSQRSNGGALGERWLLEKTDFKVPDGWDGEKPLLALKRDSAPLFDVSLDGHPEADRAYLLELVSKKRVFYSLHDVFGARCKVTALHSSIALQDPANLVKQRWARLEDRFKDFGISHVDVGTTSTVRQNGPVGSGVWGMNIDKWKHSGRESDGKDGALPSTGPMGVVFDELEDLSVPYETSNVMLSGEKQDEGQDASLVGCAAGVAECSLIYKSIGLRLAHFWFYKEGSHVPRFMSSRDNKLWGEPENGVRSMQSGISSVSSHVLRKPCHGDMSGPCYIKVILSSESYLSKVLLDSTDARPGLSLLAVPTFDLCTISGLSLPLKSWLGPTTPAQRGVSLVTQLSPDRINSLIELATAWSGPISACVFTRDVRRDIPVVMEALDRLGRKHSVDIHFIPSPGKGPYPVNALRNIAFTQVRTDAVMLVDVDFWPSPDTRSAIIKAFDERRWDKSEKIAFVIPSFDAPEGSIKAFPKNKAEVLQMRMKKTLSIVHEKKIREAHMATDYAQWEKAEKEYEVHYKYPYEPYVAMYANGPLYDSSFKGYGDDKVAHSFTLEKLSYKFMVIPDAYIIHMQHTDAQWKKEAYSSPQVSLELRWKNLFDRLSSTAKRPLEVEWIKGPNGKTCNEVCQKVGGDCDEKLFEEALDCNFLRFHLDCKGGCKSDSGGGPGIAEGTCQVGKAAAGRCAAPASPPASRLCPCKW